MYFPNITNQKHILQGGKYGCPLIFFQTKKLLKAFIYQFKMLKSTLDRVLGFAKQIPALVNLWVDNLNGKNYLKEKEEPMPMKLPNTYKNEGATSKYPK